MSFKEDISVGIKASMKSGEKLRLSTLRMLLAAVKYEEIERREDLDDAGVSRIALVLVKQRRDSIDQFRKGGRDDLADKESAELEILTAFIPPQLSPEEIEEAVKKAVEDTGATSMKEMGMVMKAAMKELKGRADGKDVQAAVKAALGA